MSEDDTDVASDVYDVFADVKPNLDIEYHLIMALGAYKRLGKALEATYTGMPDGEAKKQLYAMYQRGIQLMHPLVLLDGDLLAWEMKRRECEQ